MILIGLLLKSENGHATNDVMTQQEVKCTPNNQCKCTVSNENGVCYYVKCKIFLQMNMQSFLYENLTNTSPSKPNASTMQNEKCNNA